ncbi:uncharacterized protein TNCT_267501 [Trichonephila clavata]|uniref:Uncharacterized protein n=1 Tax=Trichonephila clavata TaxID=2740835 RepID=A0A8X6K7P3_TRICU|nr:uncharacterized protein TNCT_267501 [Trichonephila clavata]
MEDSIINLLFTEDLVTCVLTYRGFGWKSEMEIYNLRSEIQKSPFKSEVAEAVLYIWEKCNTTISGCYRDLKEMSALEKNRFGYYAMKSAHLYFDDGYSPGSFLGYCTMLIGVGYLNMDSKGVLECVCEILALVLTAFQLTGEFDIHGGWDGLLQVSETFLENVEK